MAILQEKLNHNQNAIHSIAEVKVMQPRRDLHAAVLQFFKWYLPLHSNLLSSI